MDEKKCHALVFGASGLAGWGVVDQLLSNYPTPGTFSTVTALSNRPLSVEDSFWPIGKSGEESPKFDLISGVDLMKGGVDEFAEVLREKIGDEVKSVTHVFYFAYKHEDDPEAAISVNRGMLERSIGALNLLCPNLKFVVFPSGTKAYGIHIPGGVFKAPYEETMALSKADSSTIIYPALRDVLTQQSEGKDWSWCDVCPDAIIGFVPNGSQFNLSAHWANYLSTYALISGPGSHVSFPGTSKAYNSLFNEASAEIIAKFSIWASLHPSNFEKGSMFNIADCAKPASMKERWPEICEYFGLVGVSPKNEVKAELLPGEYVEKHRSVLDGRVKKGVEVFMGEFLDSYGFYLDFDRQLSLEKIRKVGFEEELNPKESWWKAFDGFREAGMIP